MTKQLKSQISLAGKGKNYPIQEQVRRDPGLAAIISKLHANAETTTGFDNKGMKNIAAPAFNELRNVADNTARNMMDNQTVMQTLPDVESAIQILVSSVISPKDLMSGELTFSAPLCDLPADISSSLVARLKEHFERDYKIAPLLPRILRDVLAETGSYAVAVIPENSIDEVINGDRHITMESLSREVNRDGTMRNCNILGPAVRKNPRTERQTPGLSMEAFDDAEMCSEADCMMTLDAEFNQPMDTFIRVSDNPSLLKLPQINQKIRESRILSKIGSKAMESIQYKLNDREMTSAVFKNKHFAYSPVTSLKTQEQLSRRTIGNPLITHFPSDSVLPVFVPNHPEQQIGFFVLIDNDGSPLSSGDDPDHYQQLASRMNSGGSFPSAMLQKVNANMNGFNCNNRGHLDYSARVFGNMVEADILGRLRNGIYGNGVAIAKKEEVYRLMFARALAKQHTQLLFLPIELMTYFAFQYSKEGIGKSRLDNMKILNSLRSMMLFANVMAAIKNSIGRTEVKLKLDEHDPDPQKAIERIRHDLTRARMMQFPVGTNSPMDIVDFIQTANMEFTYEGHPGLPDISIDIQEKQSNNAKPDTDLEESLRKQSIMGWGIAPSTVDATFEAEFATSVVTQNLLLAKQVMQIQDQLHPLLDDHCHKVAMNSQGLLDDLRKIILDNYVKIARRLSRKQQTGLDVPPPPLEDTKKEAAPEGEVPPQEEVQPHSLVSQAPVQTIADDAAVKEFTVRRILADFVMNFNVTLPRPNSATLENQVLALDTYSKALDMGLEAYISADFLTSDTIGDIETQVGGVKAMLKAYFIRKWMAENGMLPELAELTTADEEGKPIVNIYKESMDHIAALTKSLTFFMEGITPTKRAANEKVDQINAGDNTQGGGGGGSDFGDPAGGGQGGDPFGDPFGDPAGGNMGMEPEPELEEPAPDAPTLEEPKVDGDDAVPV